MFSVVSRRTLLAAGVASAALLAAALPASAQTVDAIKAKGKVTVGMLVDFPPFGITDTAGKPDGYDADVAKLLADLGFESIDIIQLVVAIEQMVGKRKLPFNELLMRDGRYVDDLSIGQIADFLASRL